MEATREIPAGTVECAACDGTGAVPNPATHNVRGEEIPESQRGQVSCYQCGGRGYHGEDAKTRDAPTAADADDAAEPAAPRRSRSKRTAA